MDEKKGKILIYGAGAIGRGFLAPTFYKLGYEISFVDTDPFVLAELKSRNSYTTAFSNHTHYDLVEVKYANVYALGEEDKDLEKIDFVFSCVGPKNVVSFAKKLSNVPTVISFENDYETTQILKEQSGNSNCYFGIPDVITSNDAPSELKRVDPLCLVSEYGEFAIEKGNFVFPKQISTYSTEDLLKYWNCKFYLHNTPHASAAFLGKLFNVTYVHEAMNVETIQKIVNSVMESTKKAMKQKNMAESNFIDFYAQKEISRFKDKMLYDPVSRVGREPLRKLRKQDRLIESLKFISETGQDTNGICITIKAALFDVLENYNYEAFDLLEEVPTEQNILEKLSGILPSSELAKQIHKQTLVQAMFAIA